MAKHKQNDPNFKLENLLTAFDKVFTSQEVRYTCPNDKKKSVLEMLKREVNENPNMFGAEIVDIHEAINSLREDSSFDESVKILLIIAT